VHHAGANGRQRGTSRREDALDTVIALRRPEDYSPEQGARFEVHFEKLRNRVEGDGALPFEAKLAPCRCGDERTEYSMMAFAKDSDEPRRQHEQIVKLGWLELFVGGLQDL
jgi:hypothetical protein